MPAFEPTAPRIGLKLSGLPIKAPTIYTAGHALTEAEAKFLNRQVASAVANPIPAIIKAKREEAVKAGQPAPELNADKLQAFYDQRYAEYEVGAVNRGTGTATADPVARIVRNMAVDLVNAKLRAANKNILAVRQAKDAEGKSVYETIVAKAIEANPQFRELAEAQLKALAEVGTIEDMDLSSLEGIGDKPAEQTAQPETSAAA